MVLPIMDYMGRLHVKGVGTFFRWEVYIGVRGFHELKCRKGVRKLSIS